MGRLRRVISPVVPTFTATGAQGKIDLTWTKARDALSPIRYEIWRDAGSGAVPVAEVIDQLAISDTAVTPGVQYVYSVVAKDARDFHSASVFAVATAVSGTVNIILEPAHHTSFWKRPVGNGADYRDTGFDAL